MSAVERAPRQVPTNALYVNIANCGSTIFTAAGATVNWTGDLASVAAGGTLVRDMGKTVYLPDPTVPASVGSQSTIMRKVQVVRGYYGTGASSGNAAGAGGAQEYYTGYIKLGAQTYGGGGDPAPAGGAFTWARAN
jgi:hypothetical protein